MLTPYQFAANSPIQAIDLDGLEAFPVVGEFGHPGTVSGPYMDEVQAQKMVDLGYASPQIAFVKNDISAWTYSRGFSEAAGSGSLEVKLLSRTRQSNSTDLAVYATDEVSVATARVEARMGTHALAVHGGAKGSLLKAEAKLVGGILTGQDNQTGVMVDAEAGVYGVQGELYGGGQVLGIKYTYKAGLSALSAHAGFKAGITYNEESRVLKLEGLQHFGLGVGEKTETSVEIPIGMYEDLLNDAYDPTENYTPSN